MSCLTPKEFNELRQTKDKEMKLLAGKTIDYYLRKEAPSIGNAMSFRISMDKQFTMGSLWREPTDQLTKEMFGAIEQVLTDSGWHIANSYWDKDSGATYTLEAI